MKSSKTTKSASILFIAFVLITLNGCKPKCETHPDDPECAGENELITTLQVTFKDTATGTTLYTYQFKDVNNDGTPEANDTIKLQPSTTYKVELQFLNESVTPAENITTEIENEKNDHFIAFNPQGAAISVSYLDSDDNSFPIGLQTNWATGAAGNGTIRITLRHQPGVKDGTYGPGDTDMEVTFTTQVQ